VTYVPCNGCTLCCKLQTQLNRRYDDIDEYEHTWALHPERGLVPVLKRKPNGDCVYLDGGCTIYERRPHTCRVFDCREVYANRAVFRAGEMVNEIIERGRELTG